MCDETSLLLCCMEIPFIPHEAPHVRSIFHVLVSGSVCMESLGTAVAPEDVPAWGICKGGAFCPLSRDPQGMGQALLPRPWGQRAGAAGRTCRGSGSVLRWSRRGGITGCFPSVCRLKAPSPEVRASLILTSLLISVFLLSTSLRIMQRAPDWSESLKAEIPTPSCPRKAC